jgi:hypothetical protein
MNFDNKVHLLPLMGNFHFRSNNWGDRQSDVLEREGTDYVLRSDILLTYTRLVLGIQSEITYTFKYERLSFGMIRFLPTFSDLNEYSHLYQYIAEILTDKLGEASGSEDVWHNNRYRHSPNMIGHALLIGDLSYNTGWLTPTNNLFIELDNQEKPLSLRFTSIAP